MNVWVGQGVRVDLVKNSNILTINVWTLFSHKGTVCTNELLSDKSNKNKTWLVMTETGLSINTKEA